MGFRGVFMGYMGSVGLCLGFSWAVVGFRGLSWALLGSVGLCLGFSWAVVGFRGLSWAFVDFLGLLGTSLGRTYLTCNTCVGLFI